MTAPLASTGPGAYLRDARQEANMTVEKVATALLLHTAAVEAIEADAYDRLPAPAFVRGYLRGYARVLGLASGPVLEMYDRQGFGPPPLTPDVTESKQAHTSDAVVRLVTYAVVAVLVLLVGLWWHSQEDGGFGISGDLFDWSADPGQDQTATDPDEAGATPVDGEVDDASIAMASDPMEALLQGDELVPPSPDGDTATGGIEAVDPAPADASVPEAAEHRAPPPTQESESRSAADVGAGAGAESDAGAGAGDDRDAGAGAGSGDVPGAETDAGAESETDAGTDTGTGPGVDRPDSGVPAPARDSDAAGGEDAPAPPGTAGTTADAASATGRSGLVLEFEHESWVEVYDSGRNRLFFGLVRPGQVLDFVGPQPFDVLLGFGQDARVTIDGKAFDHTPFLKHGVGRFSVGSDSGAGADADADPEEPAGTAAPGDESPVRHSELPDDGR